MSKKSRLREPLDEQYGKRVGTLIQSEQHHLYHIHLSLKKSLLVPCKISRLFVNTLTADDNYSLLNREKLTQHIQIQLSHKPKNFSELISAFLKSTLNFEQFRKKMFLRDYLFPKLRTPKDVVI